MSEEIVNARLTELKNNTKTTLNNFEELAKLDSSINSYKMELQSLTSTLLKKAETLDEKYRFLVSQAGDLEHMRDGFGAKKKNKTKTCELKQTITSYFTEI